MALFDKLAKQGLSGLKGKLEKAAGVDLSRALNNLTNSAGQNQQQYAQQNARPAYGTPAYGTPAYGTPAYAPAAPVNQHARFAAILQEAFPQYAVRTAVSAAELGFYAGGPAKPYDFVLYQNGVCVGVIMLTPHNRSNNMAFKNARAAAQNAGVAFINFFTHFPNERGYVIARIRSFLG